MGQRRFIGRGAKLQRKQEVNLAMYPRIHCNTSRTCRVSRKKIYETIHKFSGFSQGVAKFANFSSGREKCNFEEKSAKLCPTRDFTVLRKTGEIREIPLPVFLNFDGSGGPKSEEKMLLFPCSGPSEFALNLTIFPGFPGCPGGAKIRVLAPDPETPGGAHNSNGDLWEFLQKNVAF